MSLPDLDPQLILWVALLAALITIFRFLRGRR